MKMIPELKDMPFYRRLMRIPYILQVSNKTMKTRGTRIVRVRKAQTKLL